MVIEYKKSSISEWLKYCSEQVDDPIDKFIFTRRSEEAKAIEAELARVKKERDSLLKDKARLDKLEKLTTGYGKGWILRESSTGRGMRLHETSRDYAYPNVRDAIDAF